MRAKLRALAVEAGLLKPEVMLEHKCRLSPQRREALRRSADALIRSGRIAQGEGLREKVKQAEYESRLRKARRVNARRDQSQ